MCDLFSGVDVS